MQILKQLKKLIMKKIILLAVFAGLTCMANAQNFKVVDTTVTFMGGLTSSPPNYIRMQYHTVTKVDSAIWLYQPQLFTYNSAGIKLVENDDLIKYGWESSGTVYRQNITAKQADLSPDSLAFYFLLPNLESIYGDKNVTMQKLKVSLSELMKP